MKNPYKQLTLTELDQIQSLCGLVFQRAGLVMTYTVSEITNPIRIISTGLLAFKVNDILTGNTNTKQQPQ